MRSTTVDEKLNEVVYDLDYLTVFEKGEVYESFSYLIKKDNDVSMIATDINLPEATQWRIEERNRHRLVIEQYPNEIIIPYADHYFEIRY